MNIVSMYWLRLRFETGEMKYHMQKIVQFLVGEILVMWYTDTLIVSAHCSVLQCCVVSCSELQWVAVRCSVLQWVLGDVIHWYTDCVSALRCIAVCCSELQWVTLSYTELLCVAVLCSVV